MKKTITLLSAILCFAISTAYATTPDSLRVKKESQSEIKAAIGYPTFAIEQGIETVVYLRGQLLESGMVEIIEIHCSNNEVLQYVINKIHSMEFNPKEYITGVPFNLRFDFKLL